MRTRLFVILAIGVLAPAPAAAQRGLLDHAEGRITGGQFPEARGLLERWRRENPAAARSDQEQMARYHLLTARVTTNADTAEYNYLTVAVDYPTARAAPEALLRLAQVQAMRGDTAQAAAYVERMIADYPDSELRPMGAVWLARLKAKGQNAAVCQLIRNISQGTNPETIQYFRAEQKRVCSAVAASQTLTPKPATEPVTTPNAFASSAPAQDDRTSTGRVAIQVGAFRELNGARGVQRQLENAGFTNVRLVRVPGNQLIRVRIGKYENRAAAAAILARLASANFSAVLVTDANSETRVMN